MGSCATPFTRVSKCRCGPVQLPVQQNDEVVPANVAVKPITAELIIEQQKASRALNPAAKPAPGKLTAAPIDPNTQYLDYKLAAGDIINVTLWAHPELTIPAGVATVPVDASVGIGELIVTVPDDVRVLVDASVGTGDLQLEGVPDTSDPSPSVTTELPGGPATGPVIDLTVHTNLGSLEVSRA